MAVQLGMVEASFSDTSQSTYQTTRHRIPQDGCLRNYRRGNLKVAKVQVAIKDIFDIQ